MAQVSRRFLRPDVWDRIFNLFLETLVNIKDKNKLHSFFAEFLSPTERIMLSKRLAIAVLLAKDHDYASIRKILHVTPGTIAKVNFYLKYESKGLQPIINDIFKRQTTQIIWEEIKGMIEVPVGSTLIKPHLRKFEIERRGKIDTIKEEF